MAFAELTSLPDDDIVVVVRGRARTGGTDEASAGVGAVALGDAAVLVMMFAEAHRIGTDQLDRRIAEVSARFDRKLDEEMSKSRLEMSAMKCDLLKWNCVFWIGQLAAMTAILCLMLRGHG